MIKRYSSLAFLALLSSSFVFSQDYNKWSLGANVGGHYGANPTTIGFIAGKISHYDLHGRYMMNNRFGLKLDIGYDSFKAKGSAVSIQTHYLRSSIQGVVNAGNVLRFETFSKHIGLLMHAGVGGSYLFNQEGIGAIRPTDGTKDWMYNIIVGVTPQVKINERISLNMDVSYITHQEQNWDFDMQNESIPNAFRNYLVNWTVGATFYLGKQKTHADWVPTIYGEDPRLDQYEQRIAKLEEQLKDDDGDGVFNYKDDEPNTPAGNLVDERGVTLVVEEVVEIDTAVATTDSPEDKREIIENALKRVHFEFGTSELRADSPERLAEFIQVLNENPEFNLLIEGHTDHVGSIAFNQKLSVERAQSVYDELLSQGLKADRMKIEGHGELKPKVPNTTPANRAINRRVELIIIEN